MFPVKDIHRSSALAGQHNGELDDDLLVTVPSLHGGPDIRLEPNAARSFIALRAHAERDGVHLEATSKDDSYRRLSVQQSIFGQRYTLADTGFAGRSCGGRYYHKSDPSSATAACPGTSNHGWAGAIDFVMAPKVEAWLRSWAYSYGWSWEIQSENWHLHYWAGDGIPPMVLDEEDDMTPEQAAKQDAIDKNVRSILQHLEGTDARLQASRKVESFKTWLTRKIDTLK